ncbi:hypothetical protein DEO72_LG4g1343 [Vigna unguiculata]|uniref:Uncharacterized protein n=1 Tax=Vigna unguiculata TaxID=3917 RepID=A0A4D6LPS9_VIGUN|nr:hypothetical protein DEO72_LG4g1343 [Vigna unguiculata]
MQRRAAVVIPCLHQRWILLKKLPHRRGIVLVRVPQNERRPTHPSLLLRRRGGRSAAAGAHRRLPPTSVAMFR